MESKKRKRDDKAQSHDDRDDAHVPRITYHAVHKSFDRLFKEVSLEDTKRLVRRKLKLTSDVDVGLEQWREGRLIDLEDDEDFAAFGALARTVPSLEVRVTVDGEGPSMTTSTPAPKNQQKKRSSSVPPTISMSQPQQQQRQTPDNPNPPLSRAQKTLLKAKKRRMSISGPTADLPPPPPPPALPHTEPTSLLALLKSKSKPKPTKRKLPADEEVHSFDPKIKVNAKAGPSTVPLSTSGVGEPSTKKRKTNDGQAKGVVRKPVSRVGAQVEGQVKEKQGKDKGKGKGKAKDIDMDMGSTAVDAPEMSAKTKGKDKEEKIHKIPDFGSTGLGGGRRAGTSRAPPVDGDRVQDVEMGEEASTTSKLKPEAKTKKKKKEKGKAKTNGKIPEVGEGAEHPVDPSATPKSTKGKAKKAATLIPPVITAEDGDDEHFTIPTRKLSAPTITWLASLDKEMALAKANGKGNAPVASTSTLPPPVIPDQNQPLKKKSKPKKSTTTTKASTEQPSVVAAPLPEEDATVIGESSSTAVSKIKKTKSKSKVSKGKDKESLEQGQDLELELEQEQVQQLEAHKKFAENLAGVISKANSSLTLPLDEGEVDVNGADVGIDNVVKPKLKKKKLSKKDFAGAGEEHATSSDFVDVAPKPKKRRKSTSTGEDADGSAIRPFNGEAAKTIKAKSMRRQSELVENDVPVDDESDVAEAPPNAEKTKVRPPRLVRSANTKEWDAKIKDATQSVLARNSPTALSPPLGAAFPSQEPEQSTATSTSRQRESSSDSEAQIEAEMSLPGKRQRSQSRLRMSWGPEDFQEDETEPSSITEAVHAGPAPAITRSPLPPSSPITRRLRASATPSVSKLSSKGKKLRESDELPCPVCLQTPFHLRYRCPVIEAGPDAIEKRLNELKKENTGHRALLIEELEHVIRNQRARANLSKSGSSSSPGSFAKSADNLLPILPTSSNGGPPSRRLTVPSGSTMSEVTVENKDEGSSNESLDDDEDSDDRDSDEDNVTEKQPNPYELPSAFADVASLADVDLEAIIRGPASQSKSVLDDIPSRSISDDEDEAAEADEDVLEDEEDDDRLYRLRSKKLEKNISSDENEGEDLAVPSGEGNREESGDEEMADMTLKPSAQPIQPPEDSSQTTQAVDGSDGFVGTEPMDDDDDERTEVAPSAENGEETDQSGLEKKKTLLAAVLGGGSPFSKGKDASSNVVPQPESPIEETYPPEDAMDIIEPSQPSAEDMNKHIDRSDPIEPADELMDSVPQGGPVGASQSRAVSQSPRKPGMAKRMKTRNGKIPLNQAVDLEADHPPVSTSLRGAKAEMRPAEPSPMLGSAVRDSARRPPNVEISSSEDVVPSLPAPAVKGPPRRGRPPLSQEVKAAREKAKADNKAQKADEKARKIGAKQVEKNEQARKHDAEKISASQPRTEVSSTVQPPTSMSIPRNLDPPQATIHNSLSPRSGMVDQLRSSSPGHLSADDDILSNGIDKRRTFLSSVPEDDQSDAVTRDNPLFILSSSQVAFPYSQWQGESYANHVEDSPTESEDEVPIESKPQPRAPSSVAPKFRRLTDIASQAMFSQDIMSSTPLPPTPVVTNKPQNQSDDSDEDEDDGDDSGSDSDTPVKSHIPKTRRAGATLRSKRRGLLSFT